MTIDLVKTDEKDLRSALNELTKDELINMLADLGSELKRDFNTYQYDLKDVPFERIRRITGYLVGTLDRFNDAKAAEERDRIKHGI